MVLPSVKRLAVLPPTRVHPYIPCRHAPRGAVRPALPRQHHYPSHLSWTGRVSELRGSNPYIGGSAEAARKPSRIDNLQRKQILSRTGRVSESLRVWRHGCRRGCAGACPGRRLQGADNPMANRRPISSPIRRRRRAVRRAAPRGSARPSTPSRAERGAKTPLESTADPIADSTPNASTMDHEMALLSARGLGDSLSESMHMGFEPCPLGSGCRHQTMHSCGGSLRNTVYPLGARSG